MDAPRTCYRHPDRETGLSCSECGRPICYECMTPAPVGLRCPDHSGKAQGVRKVTQAAGRTATGFSSRRLNAVTVALISINVAVALAELAINGQFAPNWIFDHGALIGNGCCVDGHLVGVAHGEWWRMVTSMFLHGGYLHIALNMYSLYYVGSILEISIGRWQFLLLYLGSGMAGSAGALVWSPLNPTVGASGAIFGILGALFILERRGSIATEGQIAVLIVVNLVFTFALSSYISVGAHVGGLIGGVVLMWLFHQFRRSDALYAVGATAAVIAASVVVAYAKVRGLQ
ncbi:MAG TPA: rhomboid family intramembrane serine protease [Gaiellaceae bacterium]|nr:rhomboid family intramembrane serine protease [Gaiellaceae bacterium]